MRVNNLEFDPEVIDFQDKQERQVAALRSFYCGEAPLTETDEEILLVLVDRTRVAVDSGNIREICNWLRDGKTWMAFKPIAIEEDGRLFIEF